MPLVPPLMICNVTLKTMEVYFFALGGGNCTWPRKKEHNYLDFSGGKFFCFCKSHFAGSCTRMKQRHSARVDTADEGVKMSTRRSQMEQSAELTHPERGTVKHRPLHPSFIVFACCKHVNMVCLYTLENLCQNPLSKHRTVN